MNDRPIESLHLALVTPRLVKNDGQGRVNFEIVDRFLNLGGRLTALTGSIAPELQDRSRFRWVPLGNAALPTSLLRSQLFSLQSTRYLSRHHREFDVIHANGSVTLYPSDVNASHFVHGAWARSEAHTSKYHRNAYGAYHRVLSVLHSSQERIAYSRARHVVAISDQVASQLESIGVPRQKISVIWNGIDVTEFSPGEVDRRRWSLPETGFLALFAGDMTTPRKNLDTVLDALPSVPAVHLVVAGETRKNPYVQLVKERNLSDRVTFIGFRRDLADVMKAVDAFVYPARYEPLGLVVLEALASGLPVVTARTVGASALIDSGCGIVIEEPGDVRALATALARISSEDGLRRAMGAAARARSLRYTWQRMADEYIALYASIARARENLPASA